MLKLTEIVSSEQAVDDVLTLPFEYRQKCRLSAITDSGRQVGLFLARGHVLRSNTILTGPDAINIVIKAAPEPVSVVYCDDAMLISRACYHLGNRHVALQILDGELRFLQDHVLDQMLEGLALKIRHENLPFEPEAGAYHQHHHHGH